MSMKNIKKIKSQLKKLIVLFDSINEEEWSDELNLLFDLLNEGKIDQFFKHTEHPHYWVGSMGSLNDFRVSPLNDHISDDFKRDNELFQRLMSELFCLLDIKE